MLLAGRMPGAASCATATGTRQAPVSTSGCVNATSKPMLRCCHASKPSRCYSLVLCLAQQQQQQQQHSQQRGGPSGLDVDGKRPTSPGGWARMANVLRKNNFKSLSAQEVIFARDRGTPIIDIRPAEDYATGRIPGAVNVPFYRTISGWTPWQVARRVGYAMFGVLKGTEPNPDFVAEVEAILEEHEQQQAGQEPKQPSSSTGATAVLYCSLGGSLEPLKNDPNGRQTRSLIAAHELVARGFKGVAVLRTGYDEWIESGRDVEVDGEAPEMEIEQRSPGSH